jgi:septal ring factor EnvC (AmiA/AmiB activator)
MDAEITRRDARAQALEAAQQARRTWLEFRLREIYKSGADQALRRFLEGDEVREYWTGLGYAAYLSERDRALIEEYREGRAELIGERTELARARQELGALAGEVRTARDELGAARRRHAAALDRVRADQRSRRTAIAELEVAATALESVIAEVGADGAQGPEITLDMRKFKGLLDWPAAGPLQAGFGTIVHPQFKTEVPHPGWDIAGEFGADIRAVFDGVVAFADWMRGYGLTAIVDHGGGMITVYAHASVLLVRQGDRVERGGLLGQIGETASLRGPILYFELRDGGRAVDPRPWLRAR